MSIGLLLITHPGIGPALLATARAILSGCPLRARCIEVPPDADTEQLLARAQGEIDSMDDGSGVLVLTDAYGATPSNIACALPERERIKVVSGVNLPMLIRIFNYAQEDLESITAKATEGGRRGIRTTCLEEGEGSC